MKLQKSILFVFCGNKSTEKVTNSLDGRTDIDDSRQPASLKPTQVQTSALGPTCLWTKMIKFEFLLPLCGHRACWVQLLLDVEYNCYFINVQCWRWLFQVKRNELSDVQAQIRWRHYSLIFWKMSPPSVFFTNGKLHMPIASVALSCEVKILKCQANFWEAVLRQPFSIEILLTSMMSQSLDAESDTTFKTTTAVCGNMKLYNSMTIYTQTQMLKQLWHSTVTLPQHEPHFLSIIDICFAF